MQNVTQKRNYDTLRELGALVMRLALAAVFIYHGAGKIGLYGDSSIAKTVEEFHTSLGIPPSLTYLAILAEFGGGIGLLFGFLTRLCGAGILTIMVVAIAKVHWEYGFPAQEQGWEYNMVLAAMALYFLLTGGGPVSFDTAVWGKRKKG